MARVNAGATGLAIFSNEPMLVVLPAMRLIGTSRNAFAASDATLREKLNFRLRSPALRIVAPKAAQGATFQKHCRPNSWPIVNGEALNVEDQTCHFIQLLLLEMGYLAQHPAKYPNLFFQCQAKKWMIV